MAPASALKPNVSRRCCMSKERKHLHPHTPRAASALALVAAALAACAALAAEPKEQKRELLAEHATVAKYDGLKYQQCRGMTARCPDQCGGSGNFASFTILGYLAYNKPGKYGDPKQARYTFQVDDNMKNLKVSAEIRDAVKALKPGDHVLLSWRHDYVTKNGSSGPERPITKLEKTTDERARKLLDTAEKPPEAPAGKGPGGPAPAPTRPAPR